MRGGGLGVVFFSNWANGQIHGAIGGGCVNFTLQGTTRDIYESNSIPSFKAPCLARISTDSVPLIPTCPGTHM